MRCKTLLYVRKALQGHAPRYIQWLIEVHNHGRSLRSSSRGPLLAVPRVNHAVGARSLSRRMRNVQVIFDRVTVLLELFVSSKTYRLGGHLKRAKCIVIGSGDRYRTTVSI